MNRKATMVLLHAYLWDQTTMVFIARDIMASAIQCEYSWGSWLLAVSDRPCRSVGVDTFDHHCGDHRPSLSRLHTSEPLEKILLHCIMNIVVRDKPKPHPISHTPSLPS
jgi:hypothetical protein